MSQEALGNQENNEELVIESRFGKITVATSNALFFPQGLLGLPDNLHFILADMPKENMGNFKLLQCLNDHSLSFVVLPLPLDNPLIAKADLLECCSILNVEENNLATLLIVSVQRSPEGTKITANARAPIVLDVGDKAGVQYVFPHSTYDVCTALN